MTDYTTNFNLEKYQAGDAANLNDQYNASMDVIDDNLYKINTNANTAGGKATQALETAQSNNKNLAALGVTDTATATETETEARGGSEDQGEEEGPADGPMAAKPQGALAALLALDDKGEVVQGVEMYPGSVLVRWKSR